MIKLMKLLINFTIYLQFKELYTLLIHFTIHQGKSLNFGQSDYPKTPQDTPGHSGTALFVFFNVLYERVDDVLVLIYSINVMWLYLFACIFSILEQSLFIFD